MSTKSTFGLTFYINRAKEKKNGECPVLMRININGQKLALQTKRFIKPEDWDVDKHLMKGRTTEARLFNEYIDAVKMKALKKYNELLNLHDEVSPQTLRDAILGVNTARPKMILEVWQDHIDTLKKLVGRENTEKTCQKYILSQKYFREFLVAQYRVQDISIKQVDHQMITKLHHYLLIEKNYHHNTVMKLLQKLKKMITTCIKRGWLSVDPFADISLAMRENQRAFLTDTEINKIINLNISNERLEKVRDFFLFACFTGLSYIDVKQLRKGEIEKNENGFWIRTHRQKTGIRSNIPLLKLPQEILNKYSKWELLNDNDPILPLPSNQKMNSYLKELADLCKISKELTFHVARHTFATTVTMMNGVPIESVSKMLGHKKIATTQHYARIVDKKVGEDMDILAQKLNSRFAYNH